MENLQSPLYNRQTLDYILQAFAQIVAIPEPHSFIDNEVNLDIESVAGVVSLHGSNLLNCFGKTHCEVEDCVTDLRRGCSAGEMLDVVFRAAGITINKSSGIGEEVEEGVERYIKTQLMMT